MRQVVFLVVGLCLAVSLLAAQDPVKVDSKHYKVEFENDQVRVLRITVGSHEKTPMHEHPASVDVWLTDGHVRLTLPDGRKAEAHPKAGQTTWGSGVKHAGENLGDQPFELIEAELKAAPRAAEQPKSDPAFDPVKLAPQDYKVAFENDRVRVLRITVGPHEKTPLHEHPARVVVWLTDAHVRLTLPDGKMQEGHLKAGQVIWSPAARHAGENLGDQPFESVEVELKPAGTN